MEILPKLICVHPMSYFFSVSGMVEELGMKKKLWLREFGVNIKLDSNWVHEISLIRQQTDQSAE